MSAVALTPHKLAVQEPDVHRRRLRRVIVFWNAKVFRAGWSSAAVQFFVLIAVWAYKPAMGLRCKNRDDGHKSGGALYD